MQPNIINVYEFGQTDDGILYIVMELLDGRTLHDVIASPSLDFTRTIAIALQLCDALEAAHAQGIIHRDLKPGNIVIVDDAAGRDLVKVLDFGLAKSLLSDASNITNTNAMMGTPLYMAPEQIEGRPSDQRADLYAFGCILYQMLTGRPPFVGDNINATLSKHLNERPPPLPATVPRELAAIVDALLAKNPEERIGSAARCARCCARSPPAPRAHLRSRRGPHLARAGAASRSSASPSRRAPSRSSRGSRARPPPHGDAPVADATRPDAAPLADAPRSMHHRSTRRAPARHHLSVATPARSTRIPRSRRRRTRARSCRATRRRPTPRSRRPNGCRHEGARAPPLAGARRRRVASRRQPVCTKCASARRDPPVRALHFGPGTSLGSHTSCEGSTKERPR